MRSENQRLAAENAHLQELLAASTADRRLASTLSEYSRSGRLLLDAVWPGKDQSYRALFTSSWVGTPFYPPRGAARSTRGRTTVFASWNGATQVAAWQVLAGPNAAHLRVVAKRAKTGFETAIRTGSAKAFKVRALDAHGHVLGTSAAFRG